MYYIKIPIADFSFATCGKYVARHRPTHSHRIIDTTVLLVGRSGECPISEDGREYVLKKGDYLFLCEGKEHFGTSPVSEDQSHYWCHFRLPEGWSLFESDGEPTCEEGFMILPEYGRIADFERIRMLFHQLIDCSLREFSDSRLLRGICSDYVGIIISELCEGYAEDVRAVGGNGQSALTQKLKEYIDIHALDGEVTVSELAERFHYNSNYLAQTFKGERGEAVSVYANRVRVREACRLLANTDDRIDKIAVAVGFSDDKYFMRVFRRMMGVTPSEYRRTFFRMHTNTK